MTGGRCHVVRRALLATGLALVMLGAAGCTTVRSTIDLITALHDAGFSRPGARVNTDNGGTTVVVTASSGPGEQPQVDAARITWTKFKVRFDEVDVDIGGHRQVFTRADLAERFGPRPPGSDRSITKDVLRGLAVIGAIGFVVVAGVAVLVVVLIRSAQRKRPPMPPMGPPPPGWYGPPPT